MHEEIIKKKFPFMLNLKEIKQNRPEDDVLLMKTLANDAFTAEVMTNYFVDLLIESSLNSKFFSLIY